MLFLLLLFWDTWRCKKLRCVLSFVGNSSIFVIGVSVLLSVLEVGMKWTSPLLSDKNSLRNDWWSVARLCWWRPLLLLSSSDFSLIVKETMNFLCFSGAGMVTLAPVSTIFSLMVLAFDLAVVQSWEAPVPPSSAAGFSVTVGAVVYTFYGDSLR